MVDYERKGARGLVPRSALRRRRQRTDCRWIADEPSGFAEEPGCLFERCGLVGLKPDLQRRYLPMKTPPIVSPQEWEAARQRLLVKEKAHTHARDALAAERRRMPWLAVEKQYVFDGPAGNVSLLDLFEGRRQLIV